ncbi:type II toxin-antitoxin system death-on-curing family toxin [Kineococcus terrestris]|uniref:type II toxin-antitoxin system death-on-curing family toxin n=1 Tax=Kineococcus terrestris TaxID=2044856 RepID=UPI0034DB270A
MSRPERPVDHLSLEDLLQIADGVVDGVQVRDAGLLASAAARPRTTVFGREAYPALADKAAALMHSLARNHPLVDGNKRLAWSATRVFCLLNGTDLVMDVDDAERMVLAVAAGELDAAGLSALIGDHLT